MQRQRRNSQETIGQYWGRVLVLPQEINITISLSSSVSVSFQPLSPVLLFATPWTAAPQDSLSITNSRSLPKLMSIESVMPSNHLILCRPLLFLPSIFLSIRVFSNKSVLRNQVAKVLEFQLQYSSVLPMNIQD